LKLNYAELSTTLAALRLFQNVRRHDGDLAVEQMEHFDEVDPLTDDQIDSLCERLNTECLAE
jgi:hypothetical protein